MEYCADRNPGKIRLNRKIKRGEKKRFFIEATLTSKNTKFSTGKLISAVSTFSRFCNNTVSQKFPNNKLISAIVHFYITLHLQYLNLPNISVRRFSRSEEQMSELQSH